MESGTKWRAPTTKPLLDKKDRSLVYILVLSLLNRSFKVHTVKNSSKNSELAFSGIVEGVLSLSASVVHVQLLAS